VFAFLAILGFELVALHLLGKHFHYLSYTSSPFYSGYFGHRILLFCPGQPEPLLLIIMVYDT
jgi:hypothetical protein